MKRGYAPSIWHKGLYPLCLLLAVGCFLLNPFPYHHPDSSYLRARYAQNLINGDGFGYNPDERLLLTSAPLMVLAQALFALPQGEVTAPPELLTWLVMGLALAALLRLLLREEISPRWALLAGVIVLVPMWLTFGGIEVWLMALSLIALDLAAAEKWTWAGLATGLMLLVAPAALIFVLLLGTRARPRYWWVVWLPALLWLGFTFGYFAPLRALALDSARGKGFLGIYSVLILIPLAFWLYDGLPALPRQLLIMVIWGISYSLVAILFNLTDDATLLICAALIVGVFSQPKGHRLPSISMFGLLIMLSLWALFTQPPPPSSSIPDLGSSSGHWGDNRQAFLLGGQVYDLNGRHDPHLHDLIKSGDRVGVILATAPEALLLPADGLPDDPALNQLGYQFNGIYWERGAAIFAWRAEANVNLTFSPDLRLRSVAQDRRKTEAGGILRLRLNWEMLSEKRPTGRILLLLQVLDGQGGVWGMMEQSFPKEKWAAENPTTYHVIPLNADTPAGQYTIRLSVDLDGGILGRHPIATIKVPIHSKLTFNTPPLATFDDGRQRVNLRQSVLTLHDRQLEVFLVWEALSRFEADYSIFVHLTRQDDFTPLVQGDSPPLRGRYPTSIWEAGEIIEDRYTLDLSQVPTGEYVVRVGFFHPERGRIPTPNGDSVIVGEIRLP